MHSDASAGIGMRHCVGSGRVKHLELKLMWIQKAVKGGVVKIKKCKSEDNPSDLRTKYIEDEERVKHLLGLCSMRFSKGLVRSDSYIKMS